jgi:hypothetical protein
VDLVDGRVVMIVAVDLVDGCVAMIVAAGTKF